MNTDQDQVITEIKDFIRICVAHTSYQGVTPQKLLLERGEPYYFDGATFAGPKGEMGQCYENAGRRALDGEATYVEGYVVVCGIPLEHAWLTDGNNHVLETTIRSPHDISGYFGLPISRDELAKRVVRNRFWGYFWTMGIEDLLEVS